LRSACFNSLIPAGLSFQIGVLILKWVLV
jgi:hypothetical protein